MWLFDRETLRFLAVNDATVACYGWSREQFLTMKVTETRAEDEAVAAAYIRALPEVQNDQYVGQHRRADGTTFPVGVRSRIMNYEGREVRLVAVYDITARKRAEDALSHLKAFLDTVIENVPMPIIVKTAKESRVTLINKAGEELFGFSRDEFIGKTPHDVFDDERANRILTEDTEALLSEQPLIVLEHSINTLKQGARLITSKRVSIKGADGKPEYILSLIDDVTERRQAERRIAHMAHSDSLTDLPNRAAFNERLSSTLTSAEVEGRSFAILCMDLDGFKGVNDVYGHVVGDLLLCQVADRFRIAADDTFVARLGGDEFTIIADISDRSRIAQLADRLVAAFVDDFDVDGHRLTQATSIGIAIYPADGADAKTLVSNADAALYRAKAEGSGCFQFFDEMSGLLHERTALQNDLKSAIQHNELRLHYQPQTKMNGDITGFEALARWTSPRRGIVSPAEFIPVAEESGLILMLDEWVLREACREAASWLTPLNIAVNISPVDFRHDDLPKVVHSILLETGLTPRRLELEITEGVLIDDPSRAASILLRLKSLGVRIALDDFGTGYSSLSYLRAFPFDRIKIDRSFISDLDSNHYSTAIVHAVIGLGRSLNIPTLAEGVETQAQHAFLMQEGCDEAQGYLTGRPLAIVNYADVVGRKSLVPRKALASG